MSVFDCRKHVARKFADVKGKPGEVARVTAESIFVNAQGGMIEILKLKPQGGKKMGAAEFAQAQGWPQN